MQNLTDLENTVLGIGSGAVVGITMQPTLYWKNAAQQGMPFTLNPRLLYRGLGPAMTANVGEFALQYAAIGWIKHLIVGGDLHRPMTVAEDMTAVVLGGAMVATFTSPTELAMVQQQNFGGTVWTTMKRIVAERGLVGGVTRGLMAATARDVTYAVGLFGLTPLIQDALVNKYAMNQSLAGGISSLASGVLCGALSCPFDVIKTCMQGDLPGAKYATFTSTLMAQRNRLFSGVVPRCGNVVGTFLLANEFRVRAGPLMFPHAYATTATESNQ